MAKGDRAWALWGQGRAADEDLHRRGRGGGVPGGGFTGLTPHKPDVHKPTFSKKQPKQHRRKQQQQQHTQQQYTQQHKHRQEHWQQRPPPQ